MKKKQIFGYCLLMALVVVSVIFAACTNKTAEASGFEFSYRQNSAQKVAEGEDNVVKISLDIKNKAGKENKLSAQLFSLSSEGQQISKSAYFGNNIVDKMEDEVFEDGGKMTIVISIILQKDFTGTYDLCYDGDRLLSIRI